MDLPTAQALGALRGHLGNTAPVILDCLEESFAASLVITSYEAANIYQTMLARGPELFNENLTARLTAAAEIKADTYERARICKRQIMFQLQAVLKEFRAFILPVIPFDLVRATENWVELASLRVPNSDAIGLYTRPISLAGFPVLLVPPLQRLGAYALQLIGSPGDEAFLFSLAKRLEAQS